MRDHLMTDKIWLCTNVLRAAIARIEWIFETFPSVCLSFSGGKDSTVLFHLLADVARRKKRRFSVLFIDWEAQYQCTIEHIQKMREIPSWRRICKTLIKNDFWCRTLSFSPNKPRHYERYLQRMKERRNEWGIL
ncbi:DUF3440 domain-containing protein [Escherichia coli]|nr:DUF3440 domain-containing protein [Escherichia coli]EFC7040459.1 DUF3440 domain-containing protein [Escherichia coli]EFF9571874.1 DUF3440 domain-containing protein [Escherichia coli]EJF7989018.1 DUF3440 domain-containing protein [Escherichia coli]EJZ1166286.1 DUF3440 domain-containing protein [Escherichia coli]